MTNTLQITRDISYAHTAASPGGRAVIRLLENATGRLGLLRRAKGFEREVAAGRDFWEVIVDLYGLRLEVQGGTLEHIPKTGPLIMIANHPYGILDGLMMGYILSQVRGDFRILANSVFRKSDDLGRVILPISFDETKAALAQNLETRRESLRFLGEGGAIGVFPGGTVSTAQTPFSRPLDPGWRAFTAKMVAKSDATVAPIFFDGTTSRLFQIASHLHYTLRMGLLLKEFRDRIDSAVRVVIGAPIEQAELQARAGNSKAMMDFLRKSTYELSPKPLDSTQFGFEFEEKHRA